MVKYVPKIETAHVATKQEKLPGPRYRHERNKSQGYEALAGLKVENSVKVEKKMHDCKECGKHFRKWYDLKSHQVFHTGEKPYSCDRCNRCFATQVSLKIHKLTHMDRIKFNCPFCSKSYFSSTKGAADLK